MRVDLPPGWASGWRSIAPPAVPTPPAKTSGSAAAASKPVAAHRSDAEEIIVLDHGRVAERGSHAALLARGGLYAEMWARQQAEAGNIVTQRRATVAGRQGAGP